jgi:hypothetical protein
VSYEQEWIMRLKKNQLNRPVRRSIKNPAVPPQPEPGAVGEAAVAAAARRQLDRYAEDIRQFLESSRVDTILNRLEAEFGPDVTKPSHLRIRRD